MSLRVHLKRQAKHIDVDPAGVKRFAKDVLRGERVSDGSLTILLADDRTMRELNARYRNRDRTTDVLSFPLHEEEGDGLYLGDIVISVERAREQAPRFDNDPEGELARLITHGILHLLGYDHHTPAGGRRMKQAERRALTAYERGRLLRRGEGGVA